ncbi:class E sortase [Corynebacterium sp. YSMAA1_1_F7]|uniref:class E sortase n=1 Tax=Corynebacterium sp. YSMAA1_1_F7 TaxID=3383590 RepID=UPI0025E29658|nr:class E sortase [uncultured Corynebacterium sp.]
MGRHRRPETTRLDPISVLGEILITFGVLALLFGFWDVFWTDIQSGRQQAAVAHELDEQWDEKNPRPLTEPAEGTAFARLYIPSFGSDFNFSVVKGVADEDLTKGPGHYQDSQDPGKPGNFAMAGHRVGRGSPFNDLGLLKTCDSVVVETAGNWNIYRVMPIDVDPGSRKAEAEKCMPPELAQKMAEGEYAGVNGRYITTPNDISVINPIPGQQRIEAKPEDAALLTMTTCHPQFSNKERMIVHAVLVRSEPKQGGQLPQELTEGS